MRYRIILLALAGLLAFSASYAMADVNTYTISSARTVADAQAAYEHQAAGVVTPEDEMALNKAYVHTMARLGQPKEAFAQAQALTKADPADSTAWAVIAYSQADAGQIMPALDAVSHVRPDTSRFVTRTVAQLLALFDTRVDNRDVDPGLQDALAGLRHDFRNNSAYTDAYNQAYDVYGAAEAPPPQGEAYQGNGQEGNNYYTGENNTVGVPFNNDYFSPDYYPYQPAASYDYGGYGYGYGGWWGGGFAAVLPVPPADFIGDGDFDHDDFHHHWADSRFARGDTANQLPQDVQDRFARRSELRHSGNFSRAGAANAVQATADTTTGFSMTNAFVSTAGAGSISPNFAAGSISPDFRAGSISPDFASGSISPNFGTGVVTPTGTAIASPFVNPTARSTAFVPGSTVQNTSAIRSSTWSNRNVGVNVNRSGNEMVRARAMPAQAGASVGSTANTPSIRSMWSGDRAATVSPPTTARYSSSTYRGGSYTPHSYYSGGSYTSGRNYSMPTRSAATYSRSNYSGNAYRGAVSMPRATMSGGMNYPSFARPSFAGGGRR